MTHGFYVVPIGITNKGAKIVWVVFSPDPGRVQDFGAGRHCCIEERDDCDSIGGGECDMAFAKPLSGRTWPDPKFRLSLHTKSDDVPEIHHSAAIKRGEDRVVEPGTRCHIRTLN